MENQIKDWSVVILAAGRSERMGSPKQLLPYGGKTLLEFAVIEAKSSGANEVVIVLGHAADQIIAETDMTGVRLVLNKDYESGMASSIVAGVRTLMSEGPETDAVVLMVCDQPFADSGLLHRLIAEQKETGKQIVACEYGGVAGVPVLFHRIFFDQLLGLNGDTGAKKIISQNMDSVATIPFPSGNIDIDTPEAYQNLNQNVI